MTNLQYETLNTHIDWKRLRSMFALRRFRISLGQTIPVSSRQGYFNGQPQYVCSEDRFWIGRFFVRMLGASSIFIPPQVKSFELRHELQSATSQGIDGLSNWQMMDNPERLQSLRLCPMLVADLSCFPRMDVLRRLVLHLPNYIPDHQSVCGNAVFGGEIDVGVFFRTNRFLSFCFSRSKSPRK